MFSHQIFSATDIPLVLILIGLECVLSFDNAVAMSLLVKALPHDKAKKALWIGSFSSLILRAVGILIAAYLFRFVWLQLIGAVYLIFLALKHKKSHSNSSVKNNSRRAFWKTVVLIETTDFIFALDSILAGLGLIGTQLNNISTSPKLWIVYVGGIMGIVAMRFMTTILLSITRKFPQILNSAHWLLGWIGTKLCLGAMLHLIYQYRPHPVIEVISGYVEPVFWVGFIGILLVTFLHKPTK